MTTLNPQLKIKNCLQEQIFNALQGEVVNVILNKAEYQTSDQAWREHVTGSLMKLGERLLPDYYHLFLSIQKRLGLKEEVEYYVTGNASINAFSVSAEVEGNPHIIVINSGLFNLMSCEELSFVVGHEIGHLIGNDLDIKRLIAFVFPEGTQMPIYLGLKLRLYDQLAELVADRYGYMACQDLDSCVTAFFKMESGLSLEKMNVNAKDLLEDSRRRLDYFANDKGVSRYDHPENPIRIEAINVYANADSEDALEKDMAEVINILLKVGNSPIDGPLRSFIVSAGIIAANMDGQFTEEENDFILRQLASSTIYPKSFMAQFSNLKGDDIWKIFNQSISDILSNDPGQRSAMMCYIMNLVMSDKSISQEELQFIFNFGKHLGFSEKEISQLFAGLIQQNYIPSLDSIC